MADISKRLLTMMVFPMVIAIYACNGNTKNGDEEKSEQAYDHTLKKGVITDSVVCKTGLYQSYALYLPSNYDPSSAYPCIFYFDAHARGIMPIKRYKDIAEKYGFILIGSNVSKNGIAWEQTESDAKLMMNDARSRIHIDPKRIFTSGFSGGSRVASSLAIFDGGIAGVIGCAAGFPNIQQPVTNKFYYFGLAGNDDFNLPEMEILDNNLDGSGFRHQLLSFDGKHGWPDSNDFNTAVLWMLVNEMKDSIIPKNETTITALKADYDNRLENAYASGDPIKVHELLAGEIRLLDGVSFKTYEGLSSLDKNKMLLASLEKNEDYLKAISLHTQLQQDEIKEQQDLGKQYAAQDENWWKKKMAEMYQQVKNSSDVQEKRMHQRVISYLGLVGYMYTDHALKANDQEHAATYMHIFKMADPQNPDTDILSAILLMKQGKTNEALNSLKEAAKLGYSEVVTLQNEPAFQKIANDPEFIKVLAAVKGN